MWYSEGKGCLFINKMITILVAYNNQDLFFTKVTHIIFSVKWGYEVAPF